MASKPPTDLRSNSSKSLWRSLSSWTSATSSCFSLRSAAFCVSRAVARSCRSLHFSPRERSRSASNVACVCASPALDSLRRSVRLFSTLSQEADCTLKVDCRFSICRSRGRVAE
ncbi:unnamed protein product, partial [Ixodes pacificus]